MVNDLKTPGFSIIILLGSIMTLGFFVVFFALLVKKGIKIVLNDFRDCLTVLLMSSL